MKKTIFTAGICLILLLSACGKKNVAGKNMEQIQKEQGIPVRVQIVEPSTFTQELAYNATLGGREESTAQSMVSDIVTGIRAKVGDRVSAGQLILTFPTDTPAAQFQQATTAFNAAKTAFDRMKNLLTQGAISQQDLDNLETGYKVAKANLEASDKMINVRAPISGVITNLMVSPGDKCYPGQDLFTVSTTNGFKAKLMVPDKDISKLRVGTAATATWQDQALQGRISRISLALDPNSKAVPVEVTFPAANNSIKFGSIAQIRLIINSKPDVIVVARENILTENDKKYVWVNENNHAVKRQITPGLDNQLQYEVVEGLSAGDALIVEGLNLLSDKALIRVVE